MDELEHDLRATFGQLADGAVASDALVERTLGRSTRLRHRRAAAAAAATFLVAFAVAATAATGGTRQVVNVAGPSGAGVVDSTTTTSVAPPASTTTAPEPTSVSTSAPTSTPLGASVPATTTTTIPPPCTTPPVDDGPKNGESLVGFGRFTLLANGDIRVDYYYVFGPGREVNYYVLDDGTREGSAWTRTYTPTEFGPHWYEMWSVIGGGTVFDGCRTRHTFVVDPSTATPDTTTTTGPVTTTVPDTTIPATTSTTGP